MDRVGFRAWKRPRVSIGSRIFSLYRLTDPFDPDSPIADGSIGLGPVSMRLTENKRQPAPHARPKEEKKPSLPSAPAAASPTPSASPPPRPPTPPRTEAATRPGVAPKAPASPNPRPPAPIPTAVSRKSDEREQRPQLSYIPKDYSKKDTGGDSKPKPPPLPTPIKPATPVSATPPAPTPSKAAPTPARPSGPPAPPPKPSTPSANPFGRPPPPALVGKLPVRPELRPAEPTPEAAASGPKAVQPYSDAWRRPPMPRPAPPPPRGGAGQSRGRLSLGAATVVVADEQPSTGPEVLEDLGPVTPPATRPPTPAPSQHTGIDPAWVATPSAAQMARAEPSPILRPAERTRPFHAQEPSSGPEDLGPVVAPPPVVTPPPVVAPPPVVTPPPVAAPPPVVTPPPVVAPPRPPPTPRPPPPPRVPSPKGDGLDDLFAASLDAGRLRMGRAKATGVAVADEPDKPKKAPVALPKAVLPAGLPKPKGGGSGPDWDPE